MRCNPPAAPGSAEILGLALRLLSRHKILVWLQPTG
jgi:hypothetical protein